MSDTDIADAREECWRLLQSTKHYIDCCQLHLEVNDDPVAIYDLITARDYFKAALRAFRPVRAAIRHAGAEADEALK